MVFTGKLMSQNISLDPSFGDSGMVIYKSKNNSQIHELFINSNKNLVTLSGSEFLEWNVNGQLISKIGELDFESDNLSVASGTLRFSNNKIFSFASYWNNRINELKMYNDDGKANADFGSIGFVLTSMDQQGYIKAVEHIDNHMLLATYENGVSKVRRYDQLMNVDPNFGIEETVTFNALEFIWTYISQISVFPNGDFICIGEAIDIENNKSILIRKYKANGKTDISFGFYGIVILNIYDKYPEIEFNHSIALSNGKLIIGGSSICSENNPKEQSAAVFVCFNHDGTVDGNFGKAGYSIILDEKHIGLNCMKLTALGNILCTGINNNQIEVFKLFPNGKLDKNFGSNGHFIINNTTNYYSTQYGTKIEFINNNQFYLGGSSDYAHCDTNGCLFQYHHTMLKLNFEDSPMPSSVKVDVSSKLELDLFPNPCTDFLYLKNILPQDLHSRLNIIDLNGKIVYSKIIASEYEKIEVKSIKPGVYFAEINGKTIKFIHQ